MSNKIESTVASTESKHVTRKIGESFEKPLTQEKMEEWRGWQEWAKRVDERDGSLPVELKMEDMMISILNNDQPKEFDHDWVKTHMDAAEYHRTFVQEKMIELTSQDSQREIYFYTSPIRAERTTAEKAAASLRSHFADLLAGKDVPHEGFIMFEDALEKDARMQSYTQARLKELEKFSDEQKLIVGHSNYSGDYWVTTAGELKERYRNYSIDNNIVDAEMGGIAVVAEHGDLDAFNKKTEEKMPSQTDLENQLSEDCLEPPMKPEEIRKSLLAQIQNHLEQGIDPVVLHIGGNAIKLSPEGAKQLIEIMHDEDLEDTRIVSGW